MFCALPIPFWQMANLAILVSDEALNAIYGLGHLSSEVICLQKSRMPLDRIGIYLMEDFVL